MIPFNNIPSNLRLPLLYVEIDNSQANTSSFNNRALLIGQITSAGLATPNVPTLLQSGAAAITLCGAGSMLALMAAAYRKNDPSGEVWLLPLDDAAGSTAAVGSVLITSAPTANGDLYLYIGGVRVVLPVSTTQTTAQVATALAALITGTANLPVSAAVDGSIANKVDLTALNKGPSGNDIDLRINYLGATGGEVLPAGLAVTITAMAGGTVSPTLTTGLASLNDQPFDYIANPYTDTTSLNALQSFLNDVTGRWSWTEQIYGGVFSASRGTVGALQTLCGDGARNDQHMSIMGFYDSPTPNWLWAAAYTAAAAASLRNNPAQPLHTLVLQGVLAPPLQSRFALTDRMTLNWSGIATFTVGADGSVIVEAAITTYQLNVFGQPDNSYLQVCTLFNIMYVVRFMQSALSSKYARVSLVANGTTIAAGSAVVSPNMVRGELISTFQQLEDSGNVQNAAAFAANVIVEQNATNPNRLDILWPGTLADQLDTLAMLFQFRLQ